MENTTTTPPRTSRAAPARTASPAPARTAPTKTGNLTAARECFSGRLLTDPQFDEAIAITMIIEREIRKSGAFKDKLGDYAYAFARSEKFDVMKAETILRDLFKERTGQTMNQMREALTQEREFTDAERQASYQCACDTGQMIEHGDKITFNRAYAYQGAQLALQLGITDVRAKALMRDEFKAVEESDFYEWGKELEEQFYRPQIEAETQAREARREPAGETERRSSRTRSRGRVGPAPV